MPLHHPDSSIHTAGLMEDENFYSSEKFIFSSPIQRSLGETEISYFLPSREKGVNDMYLHLGCNAHAFFMVRQRVAIVWAIMRVRHPLLASSVKMHNYDDIRFVYDVPRSPKEALFLADGCLEYRMQSKEDLINSYLNGERVLSNDKVSYLILSTTDISEGEEKNYDFLICAAHFLGDGMALHQFANEFFSLLGKSQLDVETLTEMLKMEWIERCCMSHNLPPSMEDRLPTGGRLSSIVSRVIFNLNQEKIIGYQTFPRKYLKLCHTKVLTISMDLERTRKILASCKNHGVSISSALFAVCNVAWARVNIGNWKLPMMMYSALNMRPYLMRGKQLNDSYWFLAIGYFNVVLPTFLPQCEDSRKIFWHRARLAKLQSVQAAKSPLCIYMCREMAKERGKRARIWAMQDDNPSPLRNAEASKHFKPRNSSSALLGLSLLGNLDGIYEHSNFPDIKLHTLTTGSRQRSGGMLMFCYTFVGKLWVSFGYDEKGFEENTVELFWKNVNNVINEFLLP